MTRKEAIKCLTNVLKGREDKRGKCDIDYALEVAIKALEQSELKPSYNGVKTELKPCEDAISRQAVLDIMDDLVKDFVKDNDFDKAQGVAWVKVQRLPSVTCSEKPNRSGEWIEKDGYDGDVYYDCSVCGESWSTIDGTPMENGMKYCPNCGAFLGGDNDGYE